MAQYDFGVIDTGETDGVELAKLLQDWRDAVNSGHGGTERPDYVVEGMTWRKEVSSTIHQVYLYDGTSDVFLGVLNPTTHEWTPYFQGDPLTEIATLDIGDGLEESDGTLALKSDAVFPSGTRMLFQQTNAPTGWTKETGTGFNDNALRIVTGTANGSTGSTAFSSVFGAGKATGAHTLTLAEIPSHRHRMFMDQVQTGSGGSDVEGDQRVYRRWDATGNNDYAMAGGTNEATVGATGPEGDGGSHTHTLSLDLRYTDVIVASKD